MHDLALALGGMTVGELRQRMAVSELHAWRAYIEKNGPLNPMLRFDSAIARLGIVLRGEKVQNFLMPWPKEPEAEATPEDFMNLLRASARSKRVH